MLFKTKLSKWLRRVAPADRLETWQLDETLDTTTEERFAVMRFKDTHTERSFQHFYEAVFLRRASIALALSIILQTILFILHLVEPTSIHGQLHRDLELQKEAQIEKSSMAEPAPVPATSLPEGDITTYTGPLTDRYCWDLPNHIALDGADLLTSPLDHTVHCLRDIPECIASGYIMLEQRSDGNFAIKYILDEAGNKRVTAIVDATNSIDSFQVTVSGVVDDVTGVISVTCLQETVGGSLGTLCTRDGQADPRGGVGIIDETHKNVRYAVDGFVLLCSVVCCAILARRNRDRVLANQSIDGSSIQVKAVSAVDSRWRFDAAIVAPPLLLIAVLVTRFADNADEVERSMTFSALAVTLLIGPMVLQLRFLQTLAVAPFGLVVSLAVLPSIIDTPQHQRDVRLSTTYWYTLHVAASVVAPALASLFAWRWENTLRRNFVTRILAGKSRLQTGQLLDRLLPRDVAGMESHDAPMIKRKRDPTSTKNVAQAQRRTDVTILFAAVVDFDKRSPQMADGEVVGLLNAMFSQFDDAAQSASVYKVETVCEVYMAATGLVRADNDIEASDMFASKMLLRREAEAAIQFGLVLQQQMRHFRWADGSPVELRVGIHTGPLVSGVIGQKLPRFRLFGDTVNTASRMMSTAAPGSVQISEATQRHVVGDGVPTPSFVLELLGVREIKGKGPMSTYRARLPDENTDHGGRRNVDDARSPGSQVVIMDHDHGDDEDDWFANARRGSATGKAMASMMSPGSPHRRQGASGFAMRNSGIVACLEENILRDMRVDSGSVGAGSGGERTTSAQLLFQMPEEEISTQLALLADCEDLRMDPFWLRWVQDGAEEMFLQHCGLEYLHGPHRFDVVVASTTLLAVCCLQWTFLYGPPHDEQTSPDTSIGTQTIQFFLAAFTTLVASWLAMLGMMAMGRLSSYLHSVVVLFLVLANVVSSATFFGIGVFRYGQYAQILTTVFMIYLSGVGFHIKFAVYFWLCLLMLLVMMMQLSVLDSRSGVDLHAFLMVGLIGCLQLFMSHRLEYQRRMDWKQRRQMDKGALEAISMIKRLLPAHAATRLIATDTVQGIVADTFPSVCMLFADIVGFTKLASQMHADELVQFLEQLYSAFDALVDDYGVFKVETIGDCYWCSSDLMLQDSIESKCEAMAEMALSMQYVVKTIDMPGGVRVQTDGLQLRIGLHVGQVLGGVIGQMMPRYHLFGSAVTVSQMLEQQGSPGRLNASDAFASHLSQQFWELGDVRQVVSPSFGTVNMQFVDSRLSPDDGVPLVFSFSRSNFSRSIVANSQREFGATQANGHGSPLTSLVRSNSSLATLLAEGVTPGVTPSSTPWSHELPPGSHFPAPAPAPPTTTTTAVSSPPSTSTAHPVVYDFASIGVLMEAPSPLQASHNAAMDTARGSTATQQVAKQGAGHSAVMLPSLPISIRPSSLLPQGSDADTLPTPAPQVTPLVSGAVAVIPAYAALLPSATEGQ